MTIKQKQCLLAYLGYYQGQIDGKWGAQSTDATICFQDDYGGISVDGVFGEQTEKAAKRAVAYGMPGRETDAEEETAGDGSFWADIKHFNREEFRCKCGGKYCEGFPAEPEEKLVRLADRVREHFGAAVYVSSGVRCEQHNTNVGGVSGSRHKLGKAMDFSVTGFSAGMVLSFVQTLSGVRYAYAIDGNYVHMDVE